MANHGVPGVSIALTDHGRLVFARGYGLADPASGEAVGTGHENAVGQHVLGPCGIVDMHIAIHGDEMHELVQLPEDKDDGT